MRKPSIFKSFKNSFYGLYCIFGSERNFRIECLALIINIFLIIILKLNKTDILIILAVSFGVLVCEIFNTAIEKICDIINPNYDKRVGFIKDISAGGVLLMAAFSVIVGVFVYWKYLEKILF
ncbi:diacylglycerol kinase [Chryseobacterium sp. Leaf180]|uniref:diacylglycerol kinase n=1 Tax=Chryseobacterium sp. Leaf180 TaxID=1736289 RepID=UPI000700A049|nr:diacylglycerol kinase family protein [Chryseobacterium sp. Leaf180]KQR91473.1 diacylglycerol kinase [Chryseobacterium sp. Leaf180]